MSVMRLDSVILCSRPISLRPLQKSSSRLTLVLWPAITIDRLTTANCIVVSSVHFFHTNHRNATERLNSQLSTTSPRVAQFNIAQRHQIISDGRQIWNFAQPARKSRYRPKTFSTIKTTSTLLHRSSRLAGREGRYSTVSYER